jgi:uncharacterized repeat protein (TIGR02543 family)
MAVRFAGCVVALVAALTLFVGGATGRGLATTTTAIHVEVLGLGRVTDGVGINCGNGATACRQAYVNGVPVSFTATAASGWTFDSWDGDCSDDSCDLTATTQTEDQEVIATFLPQGSPPTAHTLTVTTTGDANDDGGNVSGGGSDGVDCDTGENGTTSCEWDGLYEGSVITLIAAPEDGFVFTGWSGSCTTANVSCTLTVGTSNPTLHATFKKPRLTVTINGAGTVTGSGIACTSGSSTGCAADVDAGTDVTLTATTPSGGSFTGWGGACTGSSATCTVTMSADRAVTANFSGGSVTPTTFPLTVSVNGSGQVSGAGIACGAGGTTCSASLTAGTSVTLTATPSAGATFTSWGGACSGTSTTCSLTMSAARSVSANFSGGSTETVELAVAVTGHGVVTGGGISCGNGKATCIAKVKQESTIGLTATPVRGATFIGWSGACNGRAPTCTLQMDVAKKVSATFRGGRAPAAAHAALRSVGPPIVTRTSSGYEVTLRYTSSRRGKARIRALLAGRLESALTFNAAAGRAIAGPFPVAKSGFYSFELHLGPNTLRWTACLGRCGEHASPNPFTLNRGPATAVDAGALWSLTLHFRSTAAAGVVVSVFRGKHLAREVRFPIHAGPALPGALLLSPGNYRIDLRATDAVGRVRTLAWYALLP